ncbi:hypothetical protein C900_00372 [Fulvivirga imtechensis AK7]|uniref:Membrane or secreted protein n=1 Tax=Fulvivirga imtechensis AK7 TaxID=1237149 RepID=L8JHV8_9BACT|nr:hypothetical protein [Fulvivirga imtechensis]ELR68451.1 hypothetical protein C900_00372 [Fulvivirga imtechensis AK7]
MTTLLIGIGFVALFFGLMSVRLIFLKNGQFKGTCASQNPYLNKDGGTCGYCGRDVSAGEDCGKAEVETNEVDKVISKFK